MRVEKPNNKLPPQDIKLLYEMYKYRALSTAQVMRIGELGKWYVYKKVSQLRSAGYIYTEPISGNYIIDQNRQGSYHRINDKGISLLREHGYLIDHSSDEIKVSKYRLPYLLVGNDLCIPLQDINWEFTDSRKVKFLRNINRGDSLHGTLINPDKNKEYAIYILLRTVQDNTLARIKREITRNPFENILVVTRGSSSFNSVIHSFTDNRNRLIKGGSIKVLPFQFAQSYLNISSDNAVNHESFLKSLGINILGDRSNKNVFEENLEFDYLVEHNGEEKYFMDLLDNDLMKIRLIEEYNRDRYKRDGRKVLVLTSRSGFHLGFQKEMLDHIKHIDYFTVNPRKVVAFADNLSNKSVFEERGGKGV